jgi:O-acetyl-ADP-ribose deacetylase (regulator of RNase III)
LRESDTVVLTGDRIALVQGDITKQAVDAIVDAAN